MAVYNHRGLISSTHTYQGHARAAQPQGCPNPEECMFRKVQAQGWHTCRKEQAKRGTGNSKFTKNQHVTRGVTASGFHTHQRTGTEGTHERGGTFSLQGQR